VSAIRLIENALIVFEIVCLVIITTRFLRHRRKTTGQSNVLMVKSPTTISLFKNIKYIDETTLTKEQAVNLVDSESASSPTVTMTRAANDRTGVLFTALFLRILFYLPSILIPLDLIPNDYYVWNLFFASSFVIQLAFLLVDSADNVSKWINQKLRK